MTERVLPSRIEAVTVYRQGALVRRIAEIARNGAYPSTVAVAGLPLGIDDGSVRVQFQTASKSESPPVATDVRVALAVGERGEEPHPPDEEELEALVTREERLGEEVEAVNAAIARVRQIEVPERPERPDGVADAAPPASPADGRLELVAFQSERLRALVEEHNRLSDELREVRTRRKHLERQCERASSAGRIGEGDVTKSVVVRLVEPAVPAERAVLVIEYLVPGARWAPGYSLHLDRQMRSAQLRVRAVVCQRSGEDWRGVRLALSTADPQSWTELPDLPSMRIGRHQPPAKTGWREPPEGADGLFAEYDAFVKSPASAPPEPEPALEEDADECEVEEAFAGETLKEIDRLSAVGGAVRCEEVCDSAPPMQAMKTMACEAPCPPPAPMAMPSGAAKRAPAPRSDMKAKKMAARGMRMDDAEADDLAGTEPASDLMDYGRLRMQPPGSPERGQLRPVGTREIWIEMLAKVHVSIEFDVLGVVRAAADRARSAADVAPPRGYDVPGTIDGFDYAYVTDTPVDVLSDGQFRSVPVTAATAGVELRFVVVPRESTDVFRFAEFVNPLDSPLLPGPADVYVDDNFLLTAPMRVVAPRGTAGMGLGVEQAIKVARNTHFAEETAGMLRGSLALSHVIEIEIANNRAAAARVEVRERVPVAAPDQDGIQIEATAAPPWREYDPQPDGTAAALKGGHAWDVTVPPGATRKLSARYVITIPSKNEIAGGNRREV